MHFITCSCRRRLPALGDAIFRTKFVHHLKRVRADYGFELLGYVVMPEHFHLLISEPRRGTPSTVMPVLKQTAAQALLRSLRDARCNSRSRELLAQLADTSSGAGNHVWHRRFYDFNVRSEKKVWEKLDYMHLNPVKRKLVKEPGAWPWSSYRFYALGDSSMLAMDRWPRVAH